MTKLFGIPMGILAVVLVATLAAALAAVAVVAARNRIFFRLGIRNAERRPGRSALIVVGLMLGTAIIAAALATGDTMTQTIRSSAISSLGQTDELVAARGATPEARGPERVGDRRPVLPRGRRRCGAAGCRRVGARRRGRPGDHRAGRRAGSARAARTSPR